ncbi:hypothetical protein GmHk_06G017489 [Glycine max]|nr:hypothetical protein GmHk_06G017489 [Glycine max]
MLPISFVISSDLPSSSLPIILALTCGALMIFYSKEISVLGHRSKTASMLQGTTPHDQLLIDTSDSFSGLLLFTIGFLLLMVAFVKDIDF